jgi:hypothetical protein
MINTIVINSGFKAYKMIHVAGKLNIMPIVGFVAKRLTNINIAESDGLMMLNIQRGTLTNIITAELVRQLSCRVVSVKKLMSAASWNWVGLLNAVCRNSSLKGKEYVTYLQW